ncbi:MAG TPA: DUF3108 domain-containing protein [Pyrinomonadaceae bacterium]
MNLGLKQLLVLRSILLVLLLFGPVFAQRKSDVASYPFSTAPYRVGERLTYNVSFSSFISVAHVELLVVARGTLAGRDGIQIRGHVETTGVVNAALFSINNEYISFVDPETGVPFRTEQILREPTRTIDTANDLNQPALITPPVKQREGGFTGTFDFVSALYRLRALPLTEGSTYSFTVRGENGEEYQAEVKVSGRQPLKTNLGSFNSLVCQVHVANNSSADGYRLRMYFSDDERHIPVLITAHHSAGEIRAELAGSDFVVPPQPGPTPKATPPLVAAAPTPTPPIRQPPPTDNGLDNLPFRVGEQLNYQIFLGGGTTPVATASFQVRAQAKYSDRDGLFLSLGAQTTGAAQRLFSANDQISSYVDPKTLLPFRNEMNLVEGNRRLNQTLTINQDYGAATTNHNERIEIPVGTHDYLSFFYAVRTFSLAPPKRNAVSMLVNNRPKTIFISSLKREMIQMGSEKVPAIAVSLTTDDPQSDKFLLRAWISDDIRRLPLRLTAQTELGPLRADLAIIPVIPQ